MAEPAQISRKARERPMKREFADVRTGKADVLTTAAGAAIIAMPTLAGAASLDPKTGKPGFVPWV
eukprot:2550992-Rhodomonas_salina.1